MKSGYVILILLVAAGLGTSATTVVAETPQSEIIFFVH